MTDRSHLTDAELVDCLDGVLPASRTAHLAGCLACRNQAAGLGAVVARVNEVDVPEPSPLFWGHLSARVREAVSGTPAPARWHEWLWRPATLWGAGATVALLVALSSTFIAPRPLTPGAPAASPGRSAADTALASTEDAEPDDAELDEAWAVVRSVADEVRWDEAHEAGLAARPGAADRMVLDMTRLEQSELARVLNEELRQPGI